MNLTFKVVITIISHGPSLPYLCSSITWPICPHGTVSKKTVSIAFIYFRLCVLGNPSQLYDSVHNRILSLPKDFLLYPAHDYKGTRLSFKNKHVNLFTLKDLTTLFTLS